MILAIDLGGTKLQFGLFAPDGSLIYSDTLATDPDFLKQLTLLLKRQLGDQPDIGIVSLGVPGPVLDNVMLGSKPLNCNQGIDFNSFLSWLKVPFIVRNDLYMAAHFELYEGVGKQHQNFCMVSISTGIGVATAINGKILDRRLEMGHQILSPDFEPRLACLNHYNCWASLSSGAGIVGRFGNSNYSTTEKVFSHVLRQEDITSLRMVNAQAFGNLVTAYDPQVIVVMGSVALHQFDKIIPSPEDIASFTVNLPAPDIVRSKAGGDVGMLGACYAARDWKQGPG